MALLHRFTRAADRGNGTGIFTFIVTRSVTRDFHRDATTKEFTFGYHRWVVCFNRSDSKTLGVHLILRNASTNTTCYVDYTFCLLNREHFSKNEIYFEKRCRFDADQPAKGPARWILMNELHGRKFTDENGEFLMDLIMSNPFTVYQVDVRMSPLPFGHHHKLVSNETAYFAFGGFEWNVAIHPQGLPEEEEDLRHRPRVILNRQTGFEHAVRVRYRVILGEVAADSGLLCHVSDVRGAIEGGGFRPAVSSLAHMLRRGILRLYLEMHEANALSEVPLPGETNPASEPIPNCYDRERRAWCLQADALEERLRLRLFCLEPVVPRNHLRYVSCRGYLLMPESPPWSVLNAPHASYYGQEAVDTGIVMETDLAVEKFLSCYKQTDRTLTVQIEWIDSLLLFSATYHKYDDIRRLHCHQMKREIVALQDENYSLERQLFSYQKSISMANSRGLLSEELADEDVVNHFDDRRNSKLNENK